MITRNKWLAMVLETTAALTTVAHRATIETYDEDDIKSDMNYVSNMMNILLQDIKKVL